MTKEGKLASGLISRGEPPQKMRNVVRPEIKRCHASCKTKRKASSTTGENCCIHEMEQPVENFVSGNSFFEIYFSPTVEEILLNQLNPGIQINNLYVPHSRRDAAFMVLAFCLFVCFFNLQGSLL